MSRHIGPSEAQSNAEALDRRERTYSAASDASFKLAWDWHRREPRDLREAVRMARVAYRDEVPQRLHEGYDDIGDDGTPKWNAHAEGYIFGSSEASDAKPGDGELISYYFAPFRATLADMGEGSEQERRFAAIVTHVTIGSQRGVESAIAEGVQPWAAYIVAEAALRTFLRRLSDIKVHIPKEARVA